MKKTISTLILILATTIHSQVYLAASSEPEINVGYRFNNKFSAHMGIGLQFHIESIDEEYIIPEIPEGFYVEHRLYLQPSIGYHLNISTAPVLVYFNNSFGVSLATSRAAADIEPVFRATLGVGAGKVFDNGLFFAGEVNLGYSFWKYGAAVYWYRDEEVSKHYYHAERHHDFCLIPTVKVGYVFGKKEEDAIGQ
ncbi:MAG: hypothetical protein GF344_06345 [Chitinivibrionales bacterium]|nr:hypothetical protein [Chitinivibrionales bacterium]